VNKKLFIFDRLISSHPKKCLTADCFLPVNDCAINRVSVFVWYVEGMINRTSVHVNLSQSNRLHLNKMYIKSSFKIIIYVSSVVNCKYFKNTSSLK